jgi:glycosyltransferase involved in cell wall biosynthesis
VRILLSANTTWNISNFRWGLVKAFLAAGHDVWVAAPRDETVESIVGAGVRFHELPMERGLTSPFRELPVRTRYRSTFRRIKPHVVLLFTVKPIVYGTPAAARLGIPAICNVSGLGTVFQRRSFVRFLVERLYRYALRKAATVFFQNTEDRDLFLRRELVPRATTALLPGSGVDTTGFTPIQREPGTSVTFLLAARLLWEKGVGVYVEAARLVKEKHREARFMLAGPIDLENPSGITEETIRGWSGEGVVDYIGFQKDIRNALRQTDCLVLPSYYREGVPRSLLEAAAMALPIITTDSVGCREAVEDGVSGFLVRPRDALDLAETIGRFLALTPAERAAMGQAGRRKMETEFDESIVVERYLRAVERAVRG